MAFSDALKGQPVNGAQTGTQAAQAAQVTPEATQTAQTTQATQPTQPNGGKASSASKGKISSSEAFKASGEAQRNMMTADQKAIEGSKSDKVAFICALGDPNRKQARVEGGTSIPSYVVVGYKFQVKEDMTVPYAPLKDNCKSPLDTTSITERPVKAGEIVSLNIVESAEFISKLEFSGSFTGGTKSVKLTSKYSDSRQEPLPVLVTDGQGSIKENMELIADMIGADEANNVKGTPRIKEEFAETFGALYRKSTAGTKGSANVSKSGEAEKNIAAAFRAFYASKRA